MASSRAVRAGRAFVEFFLEDGPLQRGLKKAEARIRKFGGNIRNAGLRVLALGSAMAAPFLLGIKAASDFQETMNKFNVVFGDQAESVKQWGDNFANQVGRSKKQIADFLANTQDLFVPIGFDDDAALAISKQLTTLAVDVASFNNKLDADVLRDFHSAMTGGGETVKKYGVLMNVATVNAELLSQGIDPKKATEQQKVFARLQILLKGTTAAQGDAIRSAGSFENQMKRLRGKVDDAAVAIGTALLPVVTPLVTKLGDLVVWISRVAEKNQDLIKTVGMFVAGVLAAGAALVVIGAAIQSVAFALGGLSLAVKIIVGGFALVKTAVLATVSVISAFMSPVGLLAAAMIAVTAYFLKASGAVSALGDFLKNRLGTAWQTIVKLIGSGNLRAAGTLALEGLKATFAVGLGKVKTMWIRFRGALAETFLGGVATLENAWLSFTGFFADSFARAAAKVQAVYQDVTNGIAEYIATAIAKATGQDVGEVLETLREDQQRTNRNFEADAEREIEKRQAARAEKQKKNREFANAAIAESKAETNRQVAAADADVDKAKSNFDAAQKTADDIVAQGGEGGGEESGDNALEDLLKNLLGKSEAAGDSVAKSNAAVDVRSTAAAEEIARAFGLKGGNEVADAVNEQTAAVVDKLDEQIDQHKKAPIVKVSKS